MRLDGLPGSQESERLANHVGWRRRARAAPMPRSKACKDDCQPLALARGVGQVKAGRLARLLESGSWRCRITCGRRWGRYASSMGDKGKETRLGWFCPEGPTDRKGCSPSAPPVDQLGVIENILTHLGTWPAIAHEPPERAAALAPLLAAGPSRSGDHGPSVVSGLEVPRSPCGFVPPSRFSLTHDRATRHAPVRGSA